jgi:hypothetical protein
VICIKADSDLNCLKASLTNLNTSCLEPNSG